MIEVIIRNPVVPLFCPRLPTETVKRLSIWQRSNKSLMAGPWASQYLSLPVSRADITASPIICISISWRMRAFPKGFTSCLKDGIASITLNPLFRLISTASSETLPCLNDRLMRSLRRKGCRTSASFASLRVQSILFFCIVRLGPVGSTIAELLRRHR